MYLSDRGSVLCLLCVFVRILSSSICSAVCCCFFFFQAEDGIRDLVRSRGLGDVYKRQRLGDQVALPAALRGQELTHPRRPANSAT